MLKAKTFSVPQWYIPWNSFWLQLLERRAFQSFWLLRWLMKFRWVTVTTSTQQSPNKAPTDRNWHHRYGKWDSVHQADRDSVHRERWQKNESERFVVHRVKGMGWIELGGPTGVCPGDLCDWVRKTSGLWERPGSIEQAEGKVKRRIRPINSAIVANQDHPGRGGGSDLQWWRRGRRMFYVDLCKIFSFQIYVLSSLVMNGPTGAVLHCTYINLKTWTVISFLLCN